MWTTAEDPEFAELETQFVTEVGFDKVLQAKKFRPLQLFVVFIVVLN